MLYLLVYGKQGIAFTVPEHGRFDGEVYETSQGPQEIPEFRLQGFPFPRRQRRRKAHPGFRPRLSGFIQRKTPAPPVAADIQGQPYHPLIAIIMIGIIMIVIIMIVIIMIAIIISLTL
jgi:hypothetical protein